MGESKRSVIKLSIYLYVRSKAEAKTPQPDVHVPIYYQNLPTEIGVAAFTF